MEMIQQLTDTCHSETRHTIRPFYRAPILSPNEYKPDNSEVIILNTLSLNIPLYLKLVAINGVQSNIANGNVTLTEIVGNSKKV